MLRKKGVFFLAVLAALILTLSLLFTDSWLESQLEDMGSSIAGARVEIDDLDFSFTSVHLKWQRLQVTDARQPMKNLFETGPCAIDLEFWPLLSKKIVISDINDISFRRYYFFKLTSADIHYDYFKKLFDIYHATDWQDREEVGEEILTALKVKRQELIIELKEEIPEDVEELESVE